MFEQLAIGVVIAVAALVLAAQQANLIGGPGTCDEPGCRRKGTELCVRRGMYVCTEHADGAGEE